MFFTNFCVQAVIVSRISHVLFIFHFTSHHENNLKLFVNQFSLEYLELKAMSATRRQWDMVMIYTCKIDCFNFATEP